MLFEPHIGNAGAVLQAYRKVVEETIANTNGFPRDESPQVRGGGLVLEREFKPHKCTLVIGLHLVDAQEGAHIDVVLEPYRILTGGGRRKMVTITIRGKPDPEALMLWTPFVQRHTTLTSPVQHLVRRFHGIGRMKDLGGELVAVERMQMLFRFALHGPKSLA